MADFKVAMAALHILEGGYVNDPADPGKETYAGITRRSHPDWSGWAIVEALEPSQPGFDRRAAKNRGLRSAVNSFYKSNYWDPALLNSFADQAIANEIFEATVNIRRSRVIAWLQESLNALARKHTPLLEIDGKIGPATVGRLNEACRRQNDGPTLLVMLNVRQGGWYIKLAGKHAWARKFVRGWINNRVSLNKVS